LSHHQPGRLEEDGTMAQEYKEVFNNIEYYIIRVVLIILLIIVGVKLISAELPVERIVRALKLFLGWVSKIARTHEK
jgi:hypothetical protein